MVDSCRRKAMIAPGIAPWKRSFRRAKPLIVTFRSFIGFRSGSFALMLRIEMTDRDYPALAVWSRDRDFDTRGRLAHHFTSM